MSTIDESGEDARGLPTGNCRLSEPASVLAAAYSYVDRGWAVVPIRYRTKGGVPKGWPGLRLRRDELDAAFARGPTNIGVHMGEASAWLIDVDLDHPLARELADEFLPPTCSTFGRDSCPRSHRLYRLKESTGKRSWELDDGEEIVGLRASGHFTVLPPSRHPSNEQVRWDQDGVPSFVTPDELVASIEALANAVRKRLGLGPAAPRRTVRALAASSTKSTVSHEGRERYGKAALEEELRTLAATAPGGRNNQTYRSSIKLGQLAGAGALDESIIREGLQMAAEATGLSPREASMTIVSGVQRGLADPRDLSHLRTPPVAQRTYLVGPLELRPHKVHMTSGGKVQLEVEVVFEGVRKDFIGLSSVLSNRRDFLKSIRQLAPGVSTAAVEELVRELLLDSHEHLANPAARAMGPTMAEVLRHTIPQSLGLVFRHGPGLWSEVEGEVLSRSQLIALIPSQAIQEGLVQAIDVPRYANGQVNRPTFLRQLALESGALFASLMDGLPNLDQTDVTAETTPKLRRLIRQAILNCWLQPQSGGLVSRPFEGSDRTVQLTERCALVDKVLKQLGSPRAGNDYARAEEGWHRVQGGFAAWWRRTDGEEGPHVWLAMRHELLASCRVRVGCLDFVDQRALAVVGRKLGLILTEVDSPVPTTVGHKKQRLLVLSEELTMEILGGE